MPGFTQNANTAQEITGSNRLVSFKDNKLRDKFPASFETLFTEVSHDFSKLVASPLLRLAYAEEAGDLAA